MSFGHLCAPNAMDSTKLGKTAKGDSTTNLKASQTVDLAKGGSAAFRKSHGKTQLWKTSDLKAQKSGQHRSVYWVKKKPEDYFTTLTTKPGEQKRWISGAVYTGEWKGNVKHGAPSSSYCT